MDALTPPSDPAWAFTCLLPVWARDDPEHFTQAIASVAANTLAPSAVFICEDGPLPATLDTAVANAMETCGAVRIRNPGSRGLHHNLNHAMGAVTTPWACRADADDINTPDRFEAQVAHVRADPRIAVAGGGIEEFFPDGRSRIKTMPTTHEEILAWTRWRSPINHMTAFFRTDAFFAAGGYPDIPLKEDYGLWLAMIARGYRLANLDRVLVRARLGDDFHGRRAGLNNLASEYALFRLKRRMPQIGFLAAALAFGARSAALASRPSAGFAYERVLRR